MNTMIKVKDEFIPKSKELPPPQKEVEILKADGNTVVGYFCYSWPGNDSGRRFKRWVGPKDHLISENDVFGWREL